MKPRQTGYNTRGLGVRRKRGSTLILTASGYIWAVQLAQQGPYTLLLTETSVASDRSSSPALIRSALLWPRASCCCCAAAAAAAGQPDCSMRAITRRSRWNSSSSCTAMRRIASTRRKRSAGVARGEGWVRRVGAAAHHGCSCGAQHAAAARQRAAQQHSQQQAPSLPPPPPLHRTPPAHTRSLAPRGRARWRSALRWRWAQRAQGSWGSACGRRWPQTSAPSAQERPLRAQLKSCRRCHCHRCCRCRRTPAPGPAGRTASPATPGRPWSPPAAAHRPPAGTRRPTAARAGGRRQGGREGHWQGSVVAGRQAWAWARQARRRTRPAGTGCSQGSGIWHSSTHGCSSAAAVAAAAAAAGKTAPTAAAAAAAGQLTTILPSHGSSVTVRPGASGTPRWSVLPW